MAAHVIDVCNAKNHSAESKVARLKLIFPK